MLGGQIVGDAAALACRRRALMAAPLLLFFAVLDYRCSGIAAPRESAHVRQAADCDMLSDRCGQAEEEEEAVLQEDG